MPHYLQIIGNSMVIEQRKNKLKLQYFLYEIVHHCNLNCKGCDHCSPIADEEYVNLKQFKEDLKKLKKYFNIINAFAIMGGEPLLHPNIIEIIKISRKILNKTYIIVFTNGIDLEKQPEDFWKICKKEKIAIVITKYKINIDLKQIFEKAKNYGVEIHIEKNREKEHFHKIKFNLQGTENEQETHKNCFHGQVCHQLENGVLYKCPIVPASRHFNNFYKTNMIVDEKDGLNLNSKLNKEDIIEYFENPIPFCKYCNMEDREENKDWGISKKDIVEWT